MNPEDQESHDDLYLPEETGTSRETREQYGNGERIRSQIIEDVKRAHELMNASPTIKLIESDNNNGVVERLASLHAKEDGHIMIKEGTRQNVLEAYTYSKLLLLNIENALRSNAPVREFRGRTDYIGGKHEYGVMINVYGENISLQADTRSNDNALVDFNLSSFGEMEVPLAEDALNNNNDFPRTFEMKMLNLEGLSTHIDIHFPDPFRKMGEETNLHRSYGLSVTDRYHPPDRDGTRKVFPSVDFVNLGKAQIDYIKKLEESIR